MSFDPDSLVTVPADEQWDETLDALAHVVVHDMAERGLIRDDAEDAARYHVRSFGRRLVNPLLDQIRFEVQAGYREALEMKDQHARLQTRVSAMTRHRRRDLRIAAFFGMLWTLLVLAVGALVFGAWDGGPATSAAGTPAGQEVTPPAAPADGR
jgi:hypothetical protein